MRSSMKCVSILVLTISILIGCRLSAHAAQVPEGFTSNTLIDITLEATSIDRMDWWVLHGFRYEIMGTVQISGGHGSYPGETNKIMLYADRTTPLLSGERDWQMSPRPDNIFFTEYQTSEEHVFTFGPPYTNPENQLDHWVQTYLYTACCNLENGGSASASTTLQVSDGIL